jgi:hypothetical protein
MNERLTEELELIRSRYPSLEFSEADYWARVHDYPVPTNWGREKSEIAFQVPRDVFGQEPYGFWVRPFLALPNGGQPSNTSPESVATGFGEGWQQFSWSPDGWHPGPTAHAGSNLLDFVRSFARRLAEFN